MSYDANPLKLLNNASNGTSGEIDLNAIDRIALDVDFKTGVTAGAIVFEVAPFAGYTGAWAQVLTVTFGGAAPNIGHADTDLTARIGRARISVPLTGGVCDVYLTRKIIGKGNS
jgi:hypothetical protein